MSFNVGLSLSDTASETTAGPRSPSSTLYSSDDDAATVATPEVWNADEAVLVTGGAGFVGSHVAEHLLRRGEKVLVIDELNQYYDVSKKQANINLLEQVGREELPLLQGRHLRQIILTRSGKAVQVSQASRPSSCKSWCKSPQSTTLLCMSTPTWKGRQAC